MTEPAARDVPDWLKELAREAYYECVNNAWSSRLEDICEALRGQPDRRRLLDIDESRARAKPEADPDVVPPGYFDNLVDHLRTLPDAIEAPGADPEPLI